jgi:hypothetical protein
LAQVGFDRAKAANRRVEAARRLAILTEDEVREHALAFGDALVAGEVDRAIQDLSDELRRNLGEVLALLPLPAKEASVESIDHSGSGYNVVLRLVGQTTEDQIQTRWKDRDGKPRIVEASHLSRTATAVPVGADDESGLAEPGSGAATEDERGG